MDDWQLKVDWEYSRWSIGNNLTFSTRLSIEDETQAELVWWHECGLNCWNLSPTTNGHLFTQIECKESERNPPPLSQEWWIELKCFDRSIAVALSRHHLMDSTGNVNICEQRKKRYTQLALLVPSKSTRRHCGMSKYHNWNIWKCWNDIYFRFNLCFFEKKEEDE